MKGLGYTCGIIVVMVFYAAAIVGLITLVIPVTIVAGGLGTLILWWMKPKKMVAWFKKQWLLNKQRRALLLAKHSKKQSKVISKVMIIDSHTKRGMIGAMAKEHLLGTGALSGGRRTYTFLVEYTDRSRDVLKVLEKSRDFKILIKYLDMPNNNSLINDSDIEMYETIDDD